MPSCARVIVSVSVDIPVTRTISAFVVDGSSPAGQIVALNGTAGNNDPCPAVTTRDVPDDAGEGAVATVPTAKFLWASGTGPTHRYVVSMYRSPATASCNVYAVDTDWFESHVNSPYTGSVESAPPVSMYTTP